MFLNRLTLRLIMAIFFTGAILAIFIKCNTGRRATSSARLSTGVGSSGGVIHKTWSQYGGGADQSKYLDLKQITKQNVNKLQVAWTYSTDDNISSYRFNPLVVDNVMYVLAKNN